jgi:hypothetical protein
MTNQAHDAIEVALLVARALETVGAAYFLGGSGIEGRAVRLEFLVPHGGAAQMVLDLEKPTRVGRRAADEDAQRDTVAGQRAF